MCFYLFSHITLSQAEGQLRLNDLAKAPFRGFGGVRDTVITNNKSLNTKHKTPQIRLRRRSS